MRRFLLVGFFAALVGAGALAGCGPKRCTPGATQACACMGGQQGVQQCTAEGAFGTCDCGQLSEAEARRLVLAQDDFTDGVRCNVQVRPVSTDVYKMPSYDPHDVACLGQLVSAGLATRGDCADPRLCLERIVTPTPAARIERNMLSFPCGRVALASISGISTTGANATFRYDRDVTLDPAVMASVAECRVDVAAAGRATRERTARRDDAGHWSLAPAH